MIRYQNQLGRKINGIRRWGIDVYVDHQLVGVINGVAGGYEYVPLGKRKGNVKPTLEELKADLEGRNE